MMIFSDSEMDAFRALSLNKRRTRLLQRFCREIANDVADEASSITFFDESFDAAMTLPSMNDQEILRLCWVAYYKEEDVVSTTEYQRCQQAPLWPGRSLYLSAALESLT